MYRNKESNSNKRIYLFIGICLAISILGPIIIWGVFLYGEYHNGIPTSFEAGDVLSYIGNLSGAVVTIIGVYWTIHNNNQVVQQQLDSAKTSTEDTIEKNNAAMKLNQRLSILPIMVINKKLVTYSGNPFISLISQSMLINNSLNDEKCTEIKDDLQVSEENFSSCYYSIDGQQITISSQLNNDQIEIIRNSGQYIDKTGESVHIKQKEHLALFLFYKFQA